MEVAEEVTDKLETAIQQLGQLDYIKSLSKPGFSDISVEIKNTYSGDALKQTWDELRRKVGDVQAQLPHGTKLSTRSPNNGPRLISLSSIICGFDDDDPNIDEVADAPAAIPKAAATASNKAGNMVIPFTATAAIINYSYC